MFQHIGLLIEKVTLQILQRSEANKGAQKNLSHYINGKKAGLYGLVIIMLVAPPVPIPNTTVKRHHADGTMS